MALETYSEEEFNKVLKNLFTEKKRVKELEKQLEERGAQKKFFTKLSDIHKISIAEEYAKLKEAYHALERERDEIKDQLDKVKPVLKKLVQELLLAREEVEQFKAQFHRHEEKLQALATESALATKTSSKQ